MVTVAFYTVVFVLEICLKVSDTDIYCAIGDIIYIIIILKVNFNTLYMTSSTTNLIPYTTNF